MATKHQQANEDTSHEIEAHFIEFQKLREEILYHLNAQRQSFLLALGSATIVLPLLLGPIASLPTVTIRAILFTLTIVYSVFLISFAQSAFGLAALGAYLHSELTPKINRAIYGAKTNKVLQWENFLRDERSNIFVAMAAAGDSISSAILMLLPATFSVLAASFYGPLGSVSQNLAVTPATEAIAKLLPWVSVLAWIFFVTSVFTQVVATVYVLGPSSWMKKSN